MSITQVSLIPTVSSSKKKAESMASRIIIRVDFDNPIVVDNDRGMLNVGCDYRSPTWIVLLQYYVADRMPLRTHWRLSHTQ